MRRPRGSGAIYRRRGKWIAAAMIATSGDKRQRVWSPLCSTKAEAQRALDQLLREQRTLRSRDAVGALLARYVEHVTALGRSPTTLQRYRGLTRNLSALHRARAETLDADAIEYAYGDLRRAGISATTVRHAHALLRASLRWALRRGLIGRDPLATMDLDLPARRRTEAASLSVDDARALLAHVHRSRYGNAIQLALATGMRRGEICGLRRDAVDLERGILVVRESRYEVVGDRAQRGTKSGRSREVALSSLALDALAAERVRRAALQLAAGDAWEKSEHVFVTDFGAPISPYGLSAAFRVVAAAAGLPARYTLHSLRHTAATWMLAAGMEVPAVQRVLGHSAASTTTNIYGHVLEGRAAAAVETIAERLRRAT